MELLIGCRNKTEQQHLEKFLRRFVVVKLDEDASDRALNLLLTYRLSHGLLIADALIAATALRADAPFITKNQRDYRFISGLKLLPYI
jgi:predicted nucleic acid-binding protein